jgi:hypothetical protein
MVLKNENGLLLGLFAWSMVKLSVGNGQTFGSSHAMRNELALSSEMASDGTLLYR